MRKIVRKDAPKRMDEKARKKHWSDRHKVLITVVAIASLIGSYGLLMYLGESLR